MKLVYCVFLLFLNFGTYAQTALPKFLDGTWQREGKSDFEHWDIISDTHMKGFAFSNLENGDMVVKEYLSLRIVNDELIYTATVLNQNEGEPIHFKGVYSNNLLQVVNKMHDFPKYITYSQLKDKIIQVRVASDDKHFSYHLIKK